MLVNGYAVQKSNDECVFLRPAIDKLQPMRDLHSAPMLNNATNCSGVGVSKDRREARVSQFRE